MKPQRQRVVSKGMGDCFAACMATLLELPIEVLPNDHSPYWFIIWEKFLGQFGLAISCGRADGPIWQDYPWIAGVKSKNFENTTHAIIMDGGKVLFDPSTKKRYKKGESLLGKHVVVDGYTIAVSDFSKLHLLKEYRDKLAQEEAKFLKGK